MDTLTMALPGQFIADKRMEQFRKLARDQYDCGNKMVSAWCKASRKAMKREVSITEWKSWERLDGFTDWWNEEFPEFGGVTISDLRCAEHEFWSGIVEAMSEREAWAFSVFAKAAAAQKAAEQHNNSELDDWLTEPEGKGWFVETAEAK